MKTEMARAVIALLELPRIGRKTARKILEVERKLPQNQNDLHDALATARENGIRVPDFPLEKIGAAFVSSDTILKACIERSISIHIVHKTAEEAWLKRMNSISDAPVILYSRGDAQVLSGPCVTIIGTRKPTSWGRAAANKIAQQCVREGFCVVSGLAAGCDIAAHQGALEAGGKTVAILAHGLDMVHPKRHTNIAYQIEDGSGCLLSEYAPGTPPQRGSFVERDRLQSAAGMGTIVIETGLKGGSNHTVSFARQQGRLVGCLLHPKQYLDKESVQGNKKILQDGGVELRDSENLLQFLNDCLKNRAPSVVANNHKHTNSKEPSQGSLF